MSEQASVRCQGTDANRNFDDHWNGESRDRFFVGLAAYIVAK